LNSSISESPSPYRQLGKLTSGNPQQTVVTNLSSNQKNVLVDSGWITAVGIPGVLVIPNGIWHAYIYFAKSSLNANIESYFTISKWDGSSSTVLFTSSPVPIEWDTNNTTPVEIKINGVATTAVLAETDRVILNLYLNNNSSQPTSATFYTEGSQSYSYIVTTLEVKGGTGPAGQTGATGPQGIQGPTGPSIILIRESDYVYPYQYSGTAIDGTLTSDPGWTIKRIDFTTPGSPITLQAIGSWDNRYSLTYI